jgi:hypothetical protein
LKFTNTGGSLPTGLVSNTTYYVRTVNADSFTLSATIGGSSDVDITTDGTGTTTISLIWDTAPSGVPATSSICATTDFTDYANKIFTPASSSSPQINILPFSDGDGLPREDILNLLRPNYEPVSFPDNKGDAGPFEFDHGNGLAPLTVPISINGIASGSVLAIYKASDMSVIASPATTSGSYSASYTYTGDTNIIVRVRKGSAATKYLPYEYNGTITSTGFSLTVAQILDPIA